MTMSARSWSILGAALALLGAIAWHLLDDRAPNIGVLVIAPFVGAKVGRLLRTGYTLLRWMLRHAFVEPTSMTVLLGLGCAALAAWLGFSEAVDGSLPVEQFLGFAFGGYLAGAGVGGLLHGFFTGFQDVRELAAEDDIEQELEMLDLEGDDFARRLNEARQAETLEEERRNQERLDARTRARSASRT